MPPAVHPFSASASLPSSLTMKVASCWDTGAMLTGGTSLVEAWKHEVVLAFRCCVIGGALQPTEETRESRYFAPDAVPTNTLPKHRQRIEDALLNSPSVFIRAQRTTTVEDQGL